MATLTSQRTEWNRQRLGDARKERQTFWPLVCWARKEGRSQTGPSERDKSRSAWATSLPKATFLDSREPRPRTMRVFGPGSCLENGVWSSGRTKSRRLPNSTLARCGLFIDLPSLDLALIHIILCRSLDFIAFFPCEPSQWSRIPNSTTSWRFPRTLPMPTSRRPTASLLSNMSVFY